MRSLPVLASALLLSATGAPAPAMTPALISPESLAGTWSLVREGKTCHLSLSVSKTADGKSYEIDEGDCPEAGLPRVRGRGVVRAPRAGAGGGDRGQCGGRAAANRGGGAEERHREARPEPADGAGRG